MSREAFLPCFVCGKTLENAFPDSDNQPNDGTEFRTYGHYGSTFWDSFDGEELVLNVCDPCLREHPERLAQHKRYRPIRCNGMMGYGRQWVDRPMVAYTGNTDDGDVRLEIEELGTDLPNVEWPDNIDEMKRFADQNGLDDALETGE
jgi:hypothetical protein